MMVEKEDLGLSLSLSFPEKRAVSNPSSNVLHLNLSSLSSPSPFSIINRSSWTDVFPSSDRSSETCRVETRSFLKGIDVNCLPGWMLRKRLAFSSHSAASGKRSEREATGGSDDHDIERASSRGISDEEDAENSRKKLRLSKDQSALLEESFKEHNTLNHLLKYGHFVLFFFFCAEAKDGFGQEIGTQAAASGSVVPDRARTKLKQTEVDCEFLKRCCENLTEENRRLQKEVQELRALKLSPQFYMQMTPPTTLTMCPSCERVAVPSAPSSAPQLATAVDPRPLQMGSAQPRPITFNPWPASTPYPHRFSMLCNLDRDFLHVGKLI
ncbi:Homeobox-leucine zipper protein HAT4 [Sesamum angolense]|uniref:Homeobox-leucine zipper protein HAT4 n=1 Tax=Sesamum angolense TaxID=2727404 RepID=A0AAE2BLB2_9LAMI|nr:Homeobox-leucine zipper protein HAT4 [Sesamum angolense]